MAKRRRKMGKRYWRMRNGAWLEFTHARARDEDLRSAANATEFLAHMARMGYLSTETGRLFTEHASPPFKAVMHISIDASDGEPNQ